MVPWVKEGTVGYNLAVSLEIPSKPSRKPAIPYSIFLPPFLVPWLMKGPSGHNPL